MSTTDLNIHVFVLKSELRGKHVISTKKKSLPDPDFSYVAITLSTKSPSSPTANNRSTLRKQKQPLGKLADRDK